MSGSFNVADWYWIVAGSDSQVYSSAAAAYKPVDNPEYVAWLEAGGVPTAILNEDELRDALLANYPAGWPTPPIRIIRSLAFRERISPTKRITLTLAAITAAQAGNASLLTYLLDQAASTVVNLDDPGVKTQVNGMVAAGLLTAPEGAALLANGQPAEAP
jgi:hypothetical protein